MPCIMLYYMSQDDDVQIRVYSYHTASRGLGFFAVATHVLVLIRFTVLLVLLCHCLHHAQGRRALRALSHR